MHALHHLADASFDASFIPKVRYILPCLADDHAGFLRGHNGTEGELRVGILFIGSWCWFSIGSKAIVFSILSTKAHTAH